MKIVSPYRKAPPSKEAQKPSHETLSLFAWGLIFLICASLGVGCLQIRFEGFRIHAVTMVVRTLTFVGLLLFERRYRAALRRYENRKDKERR